jgi:uncharacterized protein (AIM24 family)
MFCVRCGARMADGANFCGGCGSRVSTAPPAVPPPSQTAAPRPSATPDPRYTPRSPAVPPATTGVQATTKCNWCGAVLEGAQATCPRCGAATGMPTTVGDSGWAQLPGRKDMAKLQCGNSSCQIEGTYVPVADMNLAAGDGVYFAHHVLLWKDPQVNITTMSLKGAWKRLFAGLPLIMTEAHGPGHVAFSMDNPGELIALPLQPGQVVDVREHRFLAATTNVQYGWFPSNIWLQTGSGNDRETFYPMGMFMDQFGATGAPGLLLLHAGGNVFVRDLAAGQHILVKPTALIFKDPRVQMQLHFERPNAVFSGWGSWSNRYIWLRLTGPGRVAIQSVFEHVEGEGRNLCDFSNATETRW